MAMTKYDLPAYIDKEMFWKPCVKVIRFCIVISTYAANFQLPDGFS